MIPIPFERILNFIYARKIIRPYHAIHPSLPGSMQMKRRGEGASYVGDGYVPFVYT